MSRSQVVSQRLVVTGASAGLGRALAALARERGWDVLGTVRRESDRAALERLGCATALLDLTDARSISAFAATTNDWCDGRLEALVHNAGTAYPGPVEELPDEDLRAQFEIGVFGPIALSQRLLPALRATGGRLLFISSDRARRSVPFYGAYVASKRALEAFAETLALEDKSVRVSILELGSFESAIRGPIGERLDRASQGSRHEAALRASRQGLGGPPIEPVGTVARVAMDLLEAPAPPLLSVFPDGSGKN
jgi:NAD(P)-dependent dehydrogenase (short-subunit alcohol dehydrogenase family)